MMSDDAKSHGLGSDHADHLREEYRDRNPDGQRRQAVPHILCKKEKEEPAPLHPQHKEDSKLVFSPLQLIQSGKVYEEEQKEQ